MKSHLAFEWLDDFADVGRDTWDELVRSSATSTVFQCYAWNKAAWQARDDGERLKILCATDREKTVGLAAFSASSESIVRFIGHRHSDFLDVICAPHRDDVRSAMLQELINIPLQWKTIELKYVPAESPTINALANASRQTLIVNSTPCPVLKIAGHEEHFDKVRRKKSLKRHHNYFRKQTAYAAHTISDPQEIVEHMPAFFEQHVRRWDTSNSPSLFNNASDRKFYLALLDILDDEPWLRFTRIEIENHTIAYHFGMSFQGMFVWYKPTFDPDMARHSPGEALLKELLELVAEEKCAEFNFTVGDEAFKLRFANHCDHNLTIVIYAAKTSYLARKFALLMRDNMRRYAAGKWLITNVKKVLAR